MKKDNKGFSLVELIVVIAIMAILVGALAPQFMKYIESSRQSTDIQSASAVRSAVEAYVAESGTSTNITITTTRSGSPAVSNIVITGDTGLATSLTSVGLASTIPCKSNGWDATASGASVAEYDVVNYTWSTTTLTNDKTPQKDLSDAFK